MKKTLDQVINAMVDKEKVVEFVMSNITEPLICLECFSQFADEDDIDDYVEGQVLRCCPYCGTELTEISR